MGRRALRESAPGQQSPVRAEAPGGAHLSPFVKGARGARPGELTDRREEAGTAGRAARAPPPAPRLFGSGRGGRGAGPLDPLAPGLLSARRFAPSHPVGRSPVSDSREAGAARTRAAQVGSGHLGCPGWDAAEDRGGTSGGGHRTSGSCGRPLGVRKPGGILLRAVERACSSLHWRNPRPAGAWEVSTPEVASIYAWAPGVGCVRSGQGTTSACRVPANADEFLPETLARFSLGLPGSFLPLKLQQTFLFCFALF